MSKKLPLTLENDTFNAFKSDFNQMLRKLLRTMEEQEAEEGVLTAKMTVKLKQDSARDFQTNGYDGTREITKPTFDHKVGITLQFKDEKSGTLGGDYEMVWDRDLGAYVMVEINNGQTSLFDEEKKERVVTAESEHSEPEQPEAPALNPPKLAQLPEPSADIIEGEYSVVSEEPNDDLKEKIEEFEHAVKYVGEDMKILHSGGDMYSIRTRKRGSIFLTSAGTAKSSFWISPEICAKHIDHELVLQAVSDDGKTIRVELKCIECDEVIWSMDNPAPDTHVYAYEQPEG